MPIHKFLFALLLAAPAAQAQQLAYEVTLIPRIDYPNGINDAGQVAGQWTPRARAAAAPSAALACRIENEFQCMPALLSPVSEPAAFVLWSGGLLLAAWWVLRTATLPGVSATRWTAAHFYKRVRVAERRNMPFFA